MKNIFLCLAFCSSHIRHSGTGHVFKDTQRALEHFRYSGTWVLGEHSEGTGRVPGHSNTRALMALGGHSRSWTLEGHSGTRALKALWHSGDGTLEALYLADSLLGDLYVKYNITSPKDLCQRSDLQNLKNRVFYQRIKLQ